MAQKQTKGLGRLIPTRATGVGYEVHYGIDVVGEFKKHGRGMTPARWTKCSLVPANSHRIPEGRYFLHTDEGKVHQVKWIDGQWHYLAPAV
jgi:hypothetical protein